MLVNITEHFIESDREWQVGQNPDVPREVAARWIADGKATADTDGVRNQSPVSGGGNGNGIAETVLSKYGKTALDITLASVVPTGATNMTWSRSAEKQRFGTQTVKIQPTADTGCLMT